MEKISWKSSVTAGTGDQKEQMPLFMDTIERNGFWQLASRFMVCGEMGNAVDEGWLSIQCCTSLVLPTCQSQRTLWRRGSTALILRTVPTKSELIQSHLSEWMDEYSYVCTGALAWNCRIKEDTHESPGWQLEPVQERARLQRAVSALQKPNLFDGFRWIGHCNSFVTNILVSTSKTQTSKLASGIPQPLR